MSCFGGIQLLSSKELNAFTLIFPYVRENVHAVRTVFWMAEHAVVENHMKMDFGRWKGEWIVTCPGNTIDNEFIFNGLMGEISRYRMHSLAFPVNAERHDIVQALVREGIECNPISQGYRGNSEPTFHWEKMITAGEVEHFGNPVLSWSNSQCMVLRKGDDIRIERAGGKTAGIVSCINALAQWKTIEAMDKPEFEIGMVKL
jgi:phage terminase large subunit-like protein